MSLERSTAEPGSAYPSTQAASQLEGEHQQLHKGKGALALHHDQDEGIGPKGRP
jgi:hypothetical protein